MTHEEIVQPRDDGTRAGSVQDRERGAAGIVGVSAPPTTTMRNLNARTNTEQLIERCRELVAR